MLTRKDKINVKLKKKMMTEKKTTTITPEEPRLEKSSGKNRKSKRIIKTFPNRQQHWTKRANLYRSNSNVW